MKHEIIDKGIFEKPGKVDQKKKKRIIANYLNMKKDLQFPAGKILLFNNPEINRKNTIDGKQYQQDYIQQWEIEGFPNEAPRNKSPRHNKSAQHSESRNPAKQNKPADNPGKIGVF